jgi:hypothetical protein
MPPRDRGLRCLVAAVNRNVHGRIDCSANGVIRSVKPAVATAYRTTTRRGSGANRSTYHVCGQQPIAVIKSQPSSDLRAAHHAKKKLQNRENSLYRAAGGMDAPAASYAHQFWPARTATGNESMAARIAQVAERSTFRRAWNGPASWQPFWCCRWAPFSHCRRQPPWWLAPAGRAAKARERLVRPRG